MSSTKVNKEKYKIKQKTNNTKKATLAQSIKRKGKKYGKDVTVEGGRRWVMLQVNNNQQWNNNQRTVSSH